jgi:cobalamin biosynthetic protein CobC
VLRSFGKFFGLAGLRLGFALASPAIAARLRAGLGPWAVAGPAIAIGAAALSDLSWTAMTRARLAQAARRLDQVLSGAGLEVAGGTSLFRLVRTPAAPELFQHLGRAGILVRRFSEQAAWLRFGLPASEPDWQRLAAAMAAVAGSGRAPGAG